MARILGYIAASLDGFIADETEGLDWLYKAEAELGEHHYDKFIKRIKTTVMGRTTYEWLVKQKIPFVYGEGREFFNVTSQSPTNDRVLFIYINFAVRQRDLQGYIAMLLDMPSMLALKQLIDSFIERTTGRAPV